MCATGSMSNYAARPCFCVFYTVRCKHYFLKELVFQCGTNLQVIRASRDIPLHEQFDVADCYCGSCVGFFLNIKCQLVNIVSTFVYIAVNLQAACCFKYSTIILELDHVASFNMELECCFIFSPQTSFCLCNCDGCCYVCVSVVDLKVVLLCLNFVRFYKLSNCYFLLVNQIACQFQHYIAFKARVSCQLQFECHCCFFFVQSSVNIVEYSLLEFKILVAAILVSIKECPLNICL